MTPDYERIEKAIDYLGRNFRRQPTLPEVAAAVGLSPYHFQRLFRRWAGVSPKRFVQFLTADYARSLLRESLPVLDTALETGLSGPGRLHDLMVSVDAATPGEVKSRGTGMEIRYGVHRTPFGECFVAATQRGVCAMRFIDSGEEQLADAAGDLSESWSNATLIEDPERTGATIARIFGVGGSESGAIPLHVRGTNFQIKVWEALLRIPPGGATSYEQVAQAIGSPRAVRAVGSAVASNQIAYLIPCHRVVRKSGAFGEYRWGPTRKRAILAWEAARTGGRPRTIAEEAPSRV